MMMTARTAQETEKESGARNKESFAKVNTLRASQNVVSYRASLEGFSCFLPSARTESTSINRWAEGKALEEAGWPGKLHDAWVTEFDD